MRYEKFLMCLSVQVPVAQAVNTRILFLVRLGSIIFESY